MLRALAHQRLGDIPAALACLERALTLAEPYAVTLAEPNALIRFAGDRVSAGTIGEELPAGYQRAEFWFSHGFVDRIVARAHLRDEIIALLGFLIAPPLNGVAEVPAVPTGAVGIVSTSCRTPNRHRMLASLFPSEKRGKQQVRVSE